MISALGHWFAVYWHCLFKTIFKPAQDHRMCSITDRGAFCSCGYGNDGVTFDQEIERTVKSYDDRKKK